MFLRLGLKEKLCHNDDIKWNHFRPMTRSFDVFFDLCLNKPLSKQAWGWSYETPSRSLWRHCNVMKNDHTHYRHFPKRFFTSMGQVVCSPLTSPRVITISIYDLQWYLFVLNKAKHETHKRSGFGIPHFIELTGTADIYRWDCRSHPHWVLFKPI